ncbi:virion structural protein [Pseudomonas phage WP1]
MVQEQADCQYTPGFPGDLIEDGPKRARPGRIMALALVTPAATATGPSRISRRVRLRR